MQNIPSPTPAVPPTKNDWDSLFQSMFDEYFIPPPNVDHLVPKVLAPVPALTSSPSSTTVDQDAPLTSTSQTTQNNNPQLFYKVLKTKESMSSKRQVFLTTGK
uniref:Integrase, catalytic region, zinc finger, CCHC-type, peptidase aspartic, catalytic n=1 Tax=Tanacetum cinerariifolium TaxID=118510 RepID=A0A6L2LEY4_TANCI|nr:hypothetical protein [Tanacetum cinerariifolium]